MPQVALDETGVHAGFEQMGGVRMSEGMDGHAGFGDASTVFGCAEGTLDTGPTHGGGRCRTLLLIAPGGGKEPGLVAVSFPVGPQQHQGLFRQGDVAVFGTLASVDMDLEALAIDVGDLKEEGFMKPKPQAIDGGEVSLIVQGCGRLEKTPDFFNAEDGGETVCGLSPNQRQRVPITLEDVLGEEADAAVANAHGSGGKAVDIFTMQEVGLEFLFGEQVGRFGIELSQQAYLTDIGLLRPLALDTALKRSNHLLTQWGHEMSPFVS